MPRAAAFLAIALVASSLPGLAQERLTEHTMKLAPDQSSPPATIEAMAWLAGHWLGEGLGGVSEEIWSAPAGGAMMGMYRHLSEGRAVFYELFTLGERNGTLTIRLKHFNPDMTGWEERDELVEFPLVAIDGDVFHFEGMSFRRRGEDEVTVYVAIGDGEAREATFHHRRVPPDVP